MKYLFGVLLFLVSFSLGSCLQTENSNSLDQDIYGSIDGSPEFLQARTVFTANCATCHIFHTLKEEEFVNTGEVLKGDAENSLIYYRLSGSSGTQGPKDMPDGGTLSADDVAKIKNWIDNIQ